MPHRIWNWLRRWDDIDNLKQEIVNLKQEIEYLEARNRCLLASLEAIDKELKARGELKAHKVVPLRKFALVHKEPRPAA